ARTGLEEDLAARGFPIQATAPDDPAAPLPIDALAGYLHELQTELIPQGLHVLGRPLGAGQRRQFLEAALQHPQPEQKVPSLDGMLDGTGEEGVPEGGTLPTE